MKIRFLGSMAVVALLAGGASSFAQGTTCGTSSILVPDGESRNAFVPAASGGDFWGFYAAANRSYVVEITGFGNPFAAFDTDIVFCAPAVVPPSWSILDRTGAEAKMNSVNGGGNGHRWVVTAPTQFGNGFVAFEVVNTNASGRSYELRILDTTLFSAAWSTNGTFDTYYSFYNSTNASISGTLVLTTAAGGAGGSVTMSIPPGRTTPSNTLALAVPRNTTGTALFFYDGPPGAIQAEAAIANFTFAPPYIQSVGFKPRDYMR